MLHNVHRAKFRTMAIPIILLFNFFITNNVFAETKLKFDHVPPKAIQAGYSFTWKGKVENNEDLDDAFFCFRTQNTKRFRCSRMTLYAGDHYKITLRGFQVQPPGLEYYVMGIDIDKKQIPLFASAKKPYLVKVTKEKVQQTETMTKDEKDVDEDELDAGEEEGKVYTASRKEQRIQKAPAVVTVLTAADIRAGGWRSLLELLRYVVGIDINNNGHWPDIGIRGVNPRVTYGDKIIILLDGHNMSWRQFNRNLLNSSWVAIDNIKRIEIIRGPGSALWGANALSGVINIITKTNSGFKGLSGSFGGSPLSGSPFISLQGGQEVLRGLNFKASFSMKNNNRSPLLAPIYEFLHPKDSSQKPIKHQPIGDSNYSQNFYAQIEWGELRITLHQSRYDPFATMSTFSKLDGDDSRFVTDRYFTKISWVNALSSWGMIFLWTSFDSYSFSQGTVYEKWPLNPNKPDPNNPKSKVRSLVKMAARDYRFELGTQLVLQPTRQLSFNIGFDFEYLDLIRWHYPEIWKKANLDTPHFNNFHLSGFAQGQYNFSNIVEVTLGGRVDYDQQYGLVATPRAAVIFTPGLGVFAKLLYGNAFKAPSFHDLYYFRKNAYYGNPDVKPESVHTAEAQLGWYRRGLMAFSINGYFSFFQNLIGYKKKQGLDQLNRKEAFPESQRPDEKASFSQKANKAELYIYGGEMEFRLFPIKGFNIRGHAGVFFGNEPGKDPSAQDYTSWFAGGLVMSYHLKLKKFGLLFSLGGLVSSPKKVPASAFSMPGGVLNTGEPVPSWTKDTDPSLETPWAIRSYATLQFLGIMKNVDLILRATNLLNVDIYDASRELFYPQKKFDLMAWIRLKY